MKKKTSSQGKQGSSHEKLAQVLQQRKTNEEKTNEMALGTVIDSFATDESEEKPDRSSTRFYPESPTL